MAKPKTYKCPVCGQPVSADEAVPLKNRYLHKRCFDSQMKIVGSVEDKKKPKSKSSKKKTEPKPQVEKKNAMSEEEYQKKKRYYDKLKSLLQTDRLDVKLYKLSENYMSEYGLSWDDMYNTLTYIYDVLNKAVEGDCVGLIPYFCSEAKRFYEKLETIETPKDGVKDLYKTRVIKIRPSCRTLPLIDIEKIGDD